MGRVPQEFEEFGMLSRLKELHYEDCFYWTRLSKFMVVKYALFSINLLSHPSLLKKLKKCLATRAQ